MTCIVPNDETWIFRPEFFGGLVHSRLDGTRYQVTSGDALFFQLLGRTGLPGSAADIVQRALPGAPYVPDMTAFEEAGLIVRSDNPPTPANGDLVDWARGVYEESQTRTYLRAPMNLSMYTLMECKAKCRMCFVRPGSWQKGMEPPERWIRLIRQARECGVPFLSFLGGDPSHYPAMDQLVRACDETRIKSTLTTIGLYMPDRLFEALVDSTWVTPTVSLQSVDDYHTRMTGWAPEGSIKTLKRLIDAGKDVRVNLVWTGQSYEQILDVLKLCINLGVVKMSVSVFFNINNVDIAVPRFSEYRKLYERVLAWVIENHPGKINFTVEGCQIYTAYPDITRPVLPGYEQLTTGCDAGNGRCEVMQDGVMVPCILLERERWAGENAFELGLQRAWDSGENMARIRAFQTQDQACTSCKFGGFCRGGCPAMNEVTYGPGNHELAGDARCEIRDGINQTNGITPIGVRLLPLMTSPATHKGQRQRPISVS